MNLLIVYATTEGQTRKIARFMQEELQHAGHQATLCDATEHPPAPDGFDAVIIGASIHISKYQSSVTHYIHLHTAALNKMPAVFFSVCLAVTSYFEEEREAAKKITSDYLEQVGWKPVEVGHIAGALKYTQYDFFKRMIMKKISKKEGRTTDASHDHEFTDWQMVKDFVRSVVDKAQKRQQHE